MSTYRNKKVILWDFDGVILNSMSIRKQGFIETLKDFPESEVQQLLDYHQANGGLSRYVKFKYFFETIRGENLKKKTLDKFATQFSEFMKEKLTTKKLLINDSLNFIKKNKELYKMHIVSGSDGQELRYLCKQLEISSYFKTIEGSPTPKIALVEALLQKHQYSLQETCLIGDSINDFEAAKKNSIDFFGYNNLALEQKGAGYIKQFE